MAGRNDISWGGKSANRNKRRLNSTVQLEDTGWDWAPNRRSVEERKERGRGARGSIPAGEKVRHSVESPGNVREGKVTVQGHLE
jgi:hypothetical protein